MPDPGLVMKALAKGQHKDGEVGRAQRHGEVGAIQIGMAALCPSTKGVRECSGGFATN